MVNVLRFWVILRLLFVCCWVVNWYPLTNWPYSIFRIPSSNINHDNIRSSKNITLFTFLRIHNLLFGGWIRRRKQDFGNAWIVANSNETSLKCPNYSLCHSKFNIEFSGAATEILEILASFFTSALWSASPVSQFTHDSVSCMLMQTHIPPPFFITSYNSWSLHLPHT